MRAVVTRPAHAASAANDAATILALQREVTRMNFELVKADLRALEARLTWKLGGMIVLWFAASAILIITR